MTFNPMADDDSGFLARLREQGHIETIGLLKAENARLTKALEYARSSLALDAAENERLSARVGRLEAALQFAIDGWDNQDINHSTYRVEVFQAATAALSSQKLSGGQNE